MVQVKKEELRRAILVAARQEFLKQGFRKASLRTIARKAKCSPGNIYSYFADKDDLMVSVAKAAMENIRRTEDALDGFSSDHFSFDFDEAREDVLRRVRILDKHREDFSLLLIKAEGSSAHGFRQEFLDEVRRIVLAKMEHFGAKHPRGRTQRLSNFFVESISAYVLDTLTKFIERDLSLDEMERYGLELAKYDHYGLLSALET